MFWHAMPPELNTARLMAGAGPAPMLQAAAGWEALAISLETQADELAGESGGLDVGVEWHSKRTCGFCNDADGRLVTNCVGAGA